ncbi:transporter substrate-binding domain-containing protein [Macrococcoides caseolyticum]|nr:transporter substrate-binding domain-containing protein [Macrococcus caseolyticus]
MSKKRDKKVMEDVNKGLDELDKDGRLRKIRKKWFGEDVCEG